MGCKVVFTLGALALWLSTDASVNTIETVILSESVTTIFGLLFLQERHRTKQLLAAQEILFPGLYHSLLTAMKPLMARDRVGMESSKMKEGNYEDFLWQGERNECEEKLLQWT